MIDVILPTYNNASFLPRAIDHILSQDFSDFKLIVVNDGSCDDTNEVLSGYKDPRIVVINHDINRGLPAALNTGHRNGDGAYCTWVSADNVSHKDHLSVLYNKMISGDFDFIQGGWCYSYDCVIGSGAKMHPEQCKHHWGYGNLGPTFLYKRVVWETYNYDEDAMYVEDLKFYLQAFLHPFKFEYVYEYLVEYLVHNKSMTQDVINDSDAHNKRLQKIYEQVIEGRS